MLARKSFLIFLTNILGAVLGVVSLVFVGRYFEPGPYGMVWFAVSFLTLIGAFTKLGFENAHVKRVSEGKDLAKCTGTFATLKLGILAVFIVVTLSVVVIREVTVGWIAATTFWVLIVALFFKSFSSLRAIFNKTFDALRLTASTQSVMLAENLGRVPLVIVVVLIFAYSRGEWTPVNGVIDQVAQWFGGIPAMTDETGAVLYAGAYAGGMLISLLTAVWLIRRHSVPFGRFDKEYAKSYWTFAWPVAIYSILTATSQDIDVVMLGYFWTGEEVGFYRAAVQFVTIVTIIPMAVRTLFFPMISELIAGRKMDAVRDLALTTQRFMSMVMVPILMLTIVYAEDVFRVVMSLTWIPAAPVLRLLVLNASLAVFTLVVASTLLGLDRVKTVMVVSLIGVFINIGLNFIFIPSSILGVPLFGLQMTGAALASVISRSVVVVIYLALSKRVLGAVLFTWSNLKHLIAAAVAGGTLWALEDGFHLVQVLHVWELAIASVVGVALYALILVVMRELRRKDMLFFIDLANPGEMRDYIRDELKGKR